MSGCGANSATTSADINPDAEKVLKAFSKNENPCGAKDIAEETGLDKKYVSTQITALKKKGLVDSPVRCKYAITPEGQAALK